MSRNMRRQANNQSTYLFKSRLLELLLHVVEGQLRPSQMFHVPQHALQLTAGGAPRPECSPRSTSSPHEQGGQEPVLPAAACKQRVSF